MGPSDEVDGPVAASADVRPPRPASAWIFDATIGWFVAQVVGGVAFTVVAGAFAVPGVRLGTAVSAGLDGGTARLSDGLPLLALALWMIPAWAVQLGTVGVAVVARGRRFVADLGLAMRPSDLLIGACAGVGAQLVIGVLYRLLDVDADGPARSLIAKGSGAAGLVGLVVLLALCAPVVEELLFRGLLMRGLEARVPRPVALFLSSAVFAAAHVQAVQFAGLFVAGLTFGALAQRRGRLAPAIAAHVAFNLVTVLYLGLA